MIRGKLSEFFFTGLMTVWPVLLWGGYHELAAVMFVSLSVAAIVCVWLEEGGDDPGPGDGGGGDPHDPARQPAAVRHDRTRER